jgi:hypothetical protein
MGLAVNAELHIIFVVPYILDFTTPESSTEAVINNLLMSKKRGQQGYGDEPSPKK